MELSEDVYQEIDSHPKNGEYDDVGAQKPREVKGHHGKCGFYVILS